MKWAFVVLNVLAAVGFYLLGSMAVAIHSAHSYSIYSEFINVGAVDQDELANLADPDLPGETGYDLLAHMRQAGNVEAWLMRISWLAAAVCILNAIAIPIVMAEGRTVQQAV